MRDLDLRRLHRDGSLIDVSTSAARFATRAARSSASSPPMIDVTARKRSERALAASEGRKDAVLRASLDAVVIVDHEGLVVEVNPATEETFGWTRNDAIGKPFLELAVAPRATASISPSVLNGSGPLARLAPRDQRPPLRITARSPPRSRSRASTCPARCSSRSRCATSRSAATARSACAKPRRSTARSSSRSRSRRTSTRSACRCQTTYMSPQIEAMLGFPVSRLARAGLLREASCMPTTATA